MATWSGFYSGTVARNCSAVDIERFFNKIRHFRAVATRFEKHDAN